MNIELHKNSTNYNTSFVEKQFKKNCHSEISTEILDCDNVVIFKEVFSSMFIDFNNCSNKTCL